MSALAGRCFTEGIDPRKKNQRCHPRRAESTARPRTRPLRSVDRVFRSRRADAVPPAPY